MVILMNDKIKAVAWATIISFGIVGCSGGADVAEDSTQFDSPTGRTISNNDSPSTGGGITSPSNPTTTNPDAPSPNGNAGDEADDPAPDPDPEAGVDPSIQDVLDRLDEIEAGVDDAEEAGNNATAAAQSAESAASDADKSADRNAWLIGGSALALLAANIVGDYWGTSSNNKTTKRAAKANYNALRDEIITTEGNVNGFNRQRHIETQAAVNQNTDARAIEVNENTNARVQEINGQFRELNERFDDQSESLSAYKGAVDTALADFDAFQEQHVEILGELTQAIDSFPEATKTALSAEFERIETALGQTQDDIEAKKALIAAAALFIDYASAESQQLDAEIASLQLQISESEGDNEDLQIQLAEALGKKAALDDQISGLSERIALLEAEVGQQEFLAEAEEAARQAAIDAEGQTSPEGVVEPAAELVEETPSFAQQLASLSQAENLDVIVFDENGNPLSEENKDGTLFVLSSKPIVPALDGLAIDSNGSHSLYRLSPDLTDVESGERIVEEIQIENEAHAQIVGELHSSVNEDIKTKLSEAGFSLTVESEPAEPAEPVEVATGELLSDAGDQTDLDSDATGSELPGDEARNAALTLNGDSDAPADDLRDINGSTAAAGEQTGG